MGSGVLVGYGVGDGVGSMSPFSSSDDSVGMFMGTGLPRLI